MNKKDFLFIFKSFLVWKIFLFICLFFAVQYVPLKVNFLGGGLEKYLTKPFLWAWANFDGEHYLSIAQNGYKPLEYFFFPLYPVLIGLMVEMFHKTTELIVIIGLLISNAAFFLSLLGLWKLLRIDFSEKISKSVIILLLLFPASFYFASFYTESLFFLFIVWSFYFARKQKWFLASIIGILASATRSTGVILLPALLIEYLIQNSNKKKLSLLWLLLIPFGLIFYMVYLYQTTGDFLAFNASGYIFGEYRSKYPVFLPQVFFRYIFRILPNLNYAYFAGTLPVILEFATACVLVLSTLFSIRKLRLSYWVYMVLGFITPTLYLNFVSLPRYAVVLFPLFIFIGVKISNFKTIHRVLIYTLLLILLSISFSMYSRGYWVA